MCKSPVFIGLPGMFGVVMGTQGDEPIGKTYGLPNGHQEHGDLDPRRGRV
jgi:hypothetical protein